MVLDGLGIGLGHLGRSGRCFAEGLLEIQVDDDAGSGAFRRRRPKQKVPRNRGTEAGRWMFLESRAQFSSTCREADGQQLTESRLPDGARPGLVTQCKEDGVHTEAQDSCRNTGRGRERGPGSMVPVPMAVVVNGDDARGRGFLMPSAQGLCSGRRDVQSTAQCLARGRAGGQATGASASPGRSRREQVNSSNGQPSTTVASQTPDSQLGRELGHLGNLIDYRLYRAAGVGLSWGRGDGQICRRLTVQDRGIDVSHTPMTEP